MSVKRYISIEVTHECMGVANCIAIAPEVFSLNEEGMSTVASASQPYERLEILKRAVMSCPTGAIQMSDEP